MNYNSIKEFIKVANCEQLQIVYTTISFKTHNNVLDYISEESEYLIYRLFIVGDDKYRLFRSDIFYAE